MKKWMAFASIGLILVGFGVTVHFSLEGKSIPKIKFSQVELPERFGQALFDRLSSEIEKQNVIVIGVAPGELYEIELVKGFIAEADKRGFQFDLILGESELPFIELIDPPQRFNLKEDVSRLEQGFVNAVSENKKLLVVMTNIYSSKLVAFSPINQIRKKLSKDLMSISISPYPLNLQDQKESLIPCVQPNQPDEKGTGKFGCQVQNLARKTFRKAKTPGMFSGLAEQTGDQDYVLIMNKNE